MISARCLPQRSNIFNAHTKGTTMSNLKLLNGDKGMSDATGFVDSIVTLADQLLDLGIESALVMDGFDDCVIGILERYGMESIVIYDKEKLLTVLYNFLF